MIKLSVSGAKQVKTSNPVASVEKKTCTKTFLFNMEKLLTTGDYADVEIHCKDGKVVKCHKNLLAARSPVLKTMLDSDFKEGNTGEIKLDYMEMDIVKVNNSLNCWIW